MYRAKTRYIPGLKCCIFFNFKLEQPWKPLYEQRIVAKTNGRAH